MEKHIPFEKLSKKQQRELNAKRRNTWGSISPITRKPNPPKAYNRRKALKWNDDSASAPFLLRGQKCLRDHCLALYSSPQFHRAFNTGLRL